MMLDVLRARRETPGCQNVLHFNNAGAALMPQSVLEATVNHLQLESQLGGYEAAKRSRSVIEQVYPAVANLIGCTPQEIAIIESATRAWDMAFYAIPFRPGDRILTAMSEYASNYIAYLHIAQRTGAKIDVIPNDESGQISIAALCNAINNKVKLIAIPHIPTNGGLVNPVAEVGKIAKAAGILYLLDACQSVGQMPVNVDEIGCDILAAAGRKYLRGPRGTGFLYVRQSLIEQLDPPFLDMHAAEWIESDRYRIRTDARRFETWETNYAAKIGLGVAINYALQWNLDAIYTQIKTLAYQLRERLETIPQVTVQDLGIEKCGIVTFSVKNQASETLQEALSTYKINVSVSPRSSTRLDMEARNCPDVIRASVHYYNSETEIEKFCTTLTKILN